MMCIDTLYMLPVRRRTRGTEEIEEMRKQEVEETKRRRNEPLQLKLSGEKYATCPKEDTRNRRNRGNEEARRRRNEETKKRTPTAEAIGGKNQR